MVQVYSGFIYRGPALVTEVLDTLETKLSELGLDSIAKAVGRDA